MTETGFCLPATCASVVRGGVKRCAHMSVNGVTRREFARTALLVAATGAALPARVVAGSGEKRPTFVKDESGVSYYDVKTGNGNSPQDGDFVTVDYVAFLSNGKVFDNRKNFVFQFGRRQVIPGLEAAVQTMRTGGQRKAVVPPALAYGSKGVCISSEDACLVQPGETLGYDITLTRVALPPT